MKHDSQGTVHAAASRSVRLIFEYEGDQIRLIHQQEVEMIPPPSAPKVAPAREFGFWLEVRDSRLHVMHRQIMHDPVVTHPEVFSNEPGKTIARAKESMRKGAFTVVVPRIADGDHIAFMRVSPETRSAAERELALPAGEVARFSLK